MTTLLSTTKAESESESESENESISISFINEESDGSSEDVELTSEKKNHVKCFTQKIRKIYICTILT